MGARNESGEAAAPARGAPETTGRAGRVAHLADSTHRGAGGKNAARGDSADAATSPRPHTAAALRYDFDHPDDVFELPNRLKEISGLTFLEDGRLAAIEDERGRVYLIDPETARVVDQRNFGRKGDYEGIEAVGRSLYVLRSDGTLFHIPDVEAADWTARKIKTHLGPKNDTEGLAYDPSLHRLLIVCKEHPGKGLKDAKAVYAFDIATGMLSETPAYSIDIARFNEHVADESSSDWLRDLVKPVMDLSGFKPSGLAVHPLTGEIYVVSSVRRAVVVLSPTGEFHAVWRLPKKPFRQPEGIAFQGDGVLFLSTEGDGGPARIARYRPLWK